MPCPHFDVKIIQRSKRQSAVASAAYQSGERLFSEYDQKQKYYSNLTGMFDTLNTKVGEIAGEVGMTPAAWNSSIFNMIRNLSETVIVPIAGIILTFVMWSVKLTALKIR